MHLPDLEAVGWAVPISGAGILVKVFSGTAHLTKMFVANISIPTQHQGLLNKREICIRNRDGWKTADNTQVLPAISKPDKRIIGVQTRSKNDLIAS